MRLEGPHTGGDPKIDFAEEEWNWGEIIPDPVVQLIGDKIATTLWDEIIACIAEHKGERSPYVSFDSETDGGIDCEPVLVVHILDTHCVIIPLGEIRLDSETLVVVDDSPIKENWPKTIERLEEMKALFLDWAAKVDGFIVEAREEQAKP